MLSIFHDIIEDRAEKTNKLISSRLVRGPADALLLNGEALMVRIVFERGT